MTTNDQSPVTDSAMTPGRAEEWARRFHETYERLAPAHGYETREASAKPWEEVPERNRALMVATVGAVLHDLLAHIKVLTDERDGLADQLGRVRMTAAADRERANEAARLSAAARDAAEDLNGQIDKMREHVEIVEEGRSDLIVELDRAEQKIKKLAAEVERVTRERDELERDEAKALRERDDRGRVADDLAEAVARLVGVEIGEHSSANDPWANALAAAASSRTEAEQLRYERRLLGACRRHLDEIADPEGRYTVEAIRTAGDLAQRIVDEIGHPVTDEPALGPEFRERIAELERELEWAVAERDHALKQIKKPDYEKLVSAYLSGAEPVAEQRERMRPVVEAAQAWRAWFPHHDSMFVPENALIATVDAYDTKSDGNAPVESPAAPLPDLDPEAVERARRCGYELLARGKGWQVMRDVSGLLPHEGGDIRLDVGTFYGHAMDGVSRRLDRAEAHNLARALTAAAPSVDGEHAPAQPTAPEGAPDA